MRTGNEDLHGKDEIVADLNGPGDNIQLMDLSGKRILVIKPSSLGDVVHTLPVVHALKRVYPTCHISWIVQEGLRGFLEGDPTIDELIAITIPSTSEPGAPPTAFLAAGWATLCTLARLRNRFLKDRYDLVLDLHASLRSGLLGLTNPGGLRMGFSDAKELNTYFQHHVVDTGHAGPHAVEKNLLFARRLGCLPAPEDFTVFITEPWKHGASLFLQEAGLGESSRIVYANPGARWRTKLWTVRCWAMLADQMRARFGATVVFAGSSADLEMINSIIELTREPAVSSAGKLSPGESVALLRRSCVYVGVDSGPMHIAAFIGTPVVALFGPTDPARVGPYGNGHAVVRRENLECLGCRKRACANRVCLEHISPEQVLETVASLLGW